MNLPNVGCGFCQVSGTSLSFKFLLPSELVLRAKTADKAEELGMPLIVEGLN